MIELPYSLHGTYVQLQRAILSVADFTPISPYKPEFGLTITRWNRCTILHCESLAIETGANQGATSGSWPSVRVIWALLEV